MSQSAHPFRDFPCNSTRDAASQDRLALQDRFGEQQILGGGRTISATFLQTRRAAFAISKDADYAARNLKSYAAKSMLSFQNSKRRCCYRPFERHLNYLN